MTVIRLKIKAIVWRLRRWARDGDSGERAKEAELDASIETVPIDEIEWGYTDTVS